MNTPRSPLITSGPSIHPPPQPPSPPLAKRKKKNIVDDGRERRVPLPSHDYPPLPFFNDTPEATTIIFDDKRGVVGSSSSGAEFLLDDDINDDDDDDDDINDESSSFPFQHSPLSAVIRRTIEMRRLNGTRRGHEHERPSLRAPGDVRKKNKSLSSPLLSLLSIGCYTCTSSSSLSDDGSSEDQNNSENYNQLMSLWREPKRVQLLADHYRNVHLSGDSHRQQYQDLYGHDSDHQQQQLCGEHWKHNQSWEQQQGLQKDQCHQHHHQEHNEHMELTLDMSTFKSAVRHPLTPGLSFTLSHGKGTFRHPRNSNLLLHIAMDIDNLPIDPHFLPKKGVRYVLNCEASTVTSPNKSPSNTTIKIKSGRVRLLVATPSNKSVSPWSAARIYRLDASFRKTLETFADTALEWYY